MVIQKNILLFIIAVSFLIPACAYRLVDDGIVLKSKEEKRVADLTTGVKVEGTTYYPYLIGYTLQDAIDEAFENAGPEYDMLVNTTADVKFYYLIIYFSKYVIVNGTAVNSKELQASMGEEKYKEWLATQNIIYRSE